jgi:hypothetical protein
MEENIAMEAIQFAVSINNLAARVKLVQDGAAAGMKKKYGGWVQAQIIIQELTRFDQYRQYQLDAKSDTNQWNLKTDLADQMNGSAKLKLMATSLVAEVMTCLDKGSKAWVTIRVWLDSPNNTPVDYVGEAKYENDEAILRGSAQEPK